MGIENLSSKSAKSQSNGSSTNADEELEGLKSNLEVEKSKMLEIFEQTKVLSANLQNKL